MLFLKEKEKVAIFFCNLDSAHVIFFYGNRKEISILESPALLNVS